MTLINRGCNYNVLIVEQSQKKTNKIYYTMGEVSEMFDVTPALLRFWQSKFPILKPHRNAKGNRLYKQKDIDNLKVIYHLVKERGMTLSGAARHMKISGGNIDRDAQIAENLMQIRSLLVELQQELSTMEVEYADIKVDNLPQDYEPGMIIFGDDE